MAQYITSGLVYSVKPEIRPDRTCRYGCTVFADDGDTVIATAWGPDEATAFQRAEAVAQAMSDQMAAMVRAA